MKSVFITFDQAFFERIMALLDRQGCRGFSYWQQVQGRGSKTGEPHYDNGPAYTDHPGIHTYEDTGSRRSSG